MTDTTPDPTTLIRQYKADVDAARELEAISRLSPLWFTARDAYGPTLASFIVQKAAREGGINADDHGHKWKGYVPSIDIPAAVSAHYAAERAATQAPQH